MKLFFVSFVAITLHLRILKCQHFTSKEMLAVMKTMRNLFDFAETKECLPAVEGKLFPDIPYVFMSCDTNQDQNLLRNFPNETHCTGFQCWESQLTDHSRLQILHIMNTYRTLVAEGICGPRCAYNNRRSIFELKWHNVLERQAISLVVNCKNEMNASFSHQLQYDNKSAWIDYVAVSFQVKEGRQQEMRMILRTLLAENHLNDWNETTNEFRRSFAIDVGCAYVLRYDVTMITTLNETVNSGNVGHLCCVFASPLPFTSPTKDQFSNFTCVTALPAFSVRMPSKDSLHRSLCSVSFPLHFIRTPVMSCQFDRIIHEKIFDSICPKPSSEPNYKTWSEKPYGLFLRFRVEQNEKNSERISALENVECNLPKIELPLLPEMDNFHNYNCTSIHEAVNEVDSSACQGWFCDDSQLTDESRHLIWHSVNTARELVAQGKCTTLCKPPCKCEGIEYCNMAELRWHWYLESKAIEKVKNCPSEYSFQKVTYLFSPFDEPVYFEEVTLVFDLFPGGQITLADKFKDLFWSNALYDWSTDGKFRRGNALWMGCAIVVRPHQNVTNMRPEFKVENGIATHMVCIFAALQEDFVSKRGPANLDCCQTCINSSTAEHCHTKMAKNSDPYPYLCSSTFSFEISMGCAINKCKTSPEASLTALSAWTKPLRGYTLIQYQNGSFEYVYRFSSEEVLKKYYVTKVCNLGTALFGVVSSVIILVVSLLYKHNTEKKYSTPF